MALNFVLFLSLVAKLFSRAERKKNTTKKKYHFRWIILKSVQWFRRCHLKHGSDYALFPILAPAAILFSGAERK